MKAQQRRMTSFDARSVMLFTVLTLSGVGALHAQTASAPIRPEFGPANRAAPSTPLAAGPMAAAPANTSASAFERADTNHDGQLSPQEAEHFPAIGQRFKELDSDHNGSLSRAEFEKGIRP